MQRNFLKCITNHSVSHSPFVCPILQKKALLINISAWTSNAMYETPLVTAVAADKATCFFSPFCSRAGILRQNTVSALSRPRLTYFSFYCCPRGIRFGWDITSTVRDTKQRTNCLDFALIRQMLKKTVFVWVKYTKLHPSDTLINTVFCMMCCILICIKQANTMCNV